METGNTVEQPLALLQSQYLQRLPKRLASWHEFWLYHCLELALYGLGCVAPNPLVGAVLVRPRSLSTKELLYWLQKPLDATPEQLKTEWPEHFELLGEGYHAAYGALHAEAAAFADAEQRGYRDFAQSILYCNLEPCSLGATEKKQPPCCEQIIEKQVFAVVFANIDPNPSVAGQGAAMLRRTGLKVINDIFALPSAMWNQNFFRYIASANSPSQRPWVSLKMAQSLDACITTKSGHSQWISGPKARAMVQALRASSGARHSAVAVGRATLEADNPNLLLRPAFLQQLSQTACHVSSVDQPWRIVWDSQMRSSRLPLQFYTSAQRHRSIVVCNTSAHNTTYEANQGISVIHVHAPLHSAAGLAEALFRLREPPYNVGQLLLEGGPRLASSFVAAGLVDEVYCFISECFIGGGLHSLGDFHPNRQQVSLAEALPLQHTSYMQIHENDWDGPNELLFHGYLQKIWVPEIY